MGEVSGPGLRGGRSETGFSIALDVGGDENVHIEAAYENNPAASYLILATDIPADHQIIFPDPATSGALNLVFTSTGMTPAFPLASGVTWVSETTAPVIQLNSPDESATAVFALAWPVFSGAPEGQWIVWFLNN